MSAPQDADQASTHTPTPTPPPQAPKPGIRFKSKRKRSTPSEPDPNKRRSLSPSTSTSHRSHRHRHHHHHHRSHHRRPHTPPPDSSSTHTPFPEAHLDPETAFRESLFDALADDEGAAYWEGVYGQSMHTYSQYHYRKGSGDGGGEPEEGTLERMTDDEYVSYVRGKMWEKSYGYIAEERRRREEERGKAGKAGEEREGRRRTVDREEGRKWKMDVEEALRRGEERRRKDRWKRAWDGYVAGWDGMVLNAEGKGKKKDLRERIRWPVESGKWKDVEREEIERFYKHAAAAGGGVDVGDVLKKERVRWHPDKMLQRAGGRAIDEATMRLVTAVFQVVDKLWGDMK